MSLIKTLIKIVIIIFTLLYYNNNLISQNHTIFIDDTVFYNLKKSICFFGEYNVKFKDSLSDGRWILHNLKREDSLKKRDETIILTGEFKNYKKNGIFNYYGYHINRNKKKQKKLTYTNYVKLSESFKDGILNGLVIEKQHGDFQTPGALKESRYENGKKNGVEIVYNYQSSYFGLLRGVNYYQNDTVIEWFNYFHVYKNIIAGHGIKLNANEDYIYSEYNPNGSIKAKYYYFSGILNKYERYYENQMLMITMEGRFNECHNIYNKIKYNINSNIVLHEIMGFDCDLKLLNGLETIFNYEGEVFKKNVYKDGIIVK